MERVELLEAGVDVLLQDEICEKRQGKIIYNKCLIMNEKQSDKILVYYTILCVIFFTSVAHPIPLTQPLNKPFWILHCNAMQRPMLFDKSSTIDAYYFFIRKCFLELFGGNNIFVGAICWH